MPLSDDVQAIVYRPTVRYNPIFERYVTELFHATTLDRNQLIRLALFTSPFAGLFQSRLDRYMKPGAEKPAALWTPKDTPIWKELL